VSARRLLVLCYFYPPLAGGGVHRVLGFTRYLPRHGWACTVVCAGEDDYWVTDSSLLARVPAETDVVRVRGGSALSAWLAWRRRDRGRRPGGVFAGLRRLSDWFLMPDSYVGWARRARRVAAGLLAAGDFDAVLSSSPPDSVHLAALDVRRRFGLPWVVDFRDPWIPLYFREPPSGWHRARQAALERRVIEGADLVLTASATHAGMLGARSGARARRVLHLANGYEPDAATAAPPAAALAESFLVVFTGTLSQMPDAEVFFEALHDLFARRSEARRRLRVVIAGPFESHYEDRARALGLTGIVRFAGPLAHGESRALQRRADLLLLWKFRGFPTMVPGKVYEYLDAGRPLLGLLEAQDEVAELVRRAGGTVVAPGDRVALADAIERRYLAWCEGGAAASARPDWLVDHTREALTVRLASALDALVEARA